MLQHHHASPGGKAAPPTVLRMASSSVGSVTTTDSGDENEWDDELEERPAGLRKRAKSTGEPTRLSFSSESSASEQRTAAPRRRRPMYLLQKEERDDLVEQLRLLKARLELLQLKAGVSTLGDDKSVASLEAEKARVDAEIRGNLDLFARLHSLVTHRLHMTPVMPLYSRIHLPADRAERRAILESLREVKIRRAIEVGLNRLWARDMSKPYRHHERRMLPDGACQATYFQIQQFEGLQSVRQLYNALQFYHHNLEISVSEILGQMTLREDDHEDDASVFNQVFVTTGELGGVEELNRVGFCQFYDSYPPHNGAQFGVITINTVDEDDLYPYKPLERTHKVAQHVFTMSEYRKPGTGELVVVLMTCLFTTQPRPQFDIPAIVWDKLLENMPRWSLAMNKFLRESVAAFADSARC